MFVLGAIAVAILFVLAIYSGIWWVWCWVMPQLWPSGPEGIINPGFWLFIAACFLLNFVGKLIFGGKVKENK